MTIHVTLGTLMLLGGYGNILTFHICSPGDVLWGTTTRTRFLEQFASAVQIGATRASKSRNTKFSLPEITTLPIISWVWNLQDLQFSNITCPEEGKKQTQKV